MRRGRRWWIWRWRRRFSWAAVAGCLWVALTVVPAAAGTARLGRGCPPPVILPPLTLLAAAVSLQGVPLPSRSAPPVAIPADRQLVIDAVRRRLYVFDGTALVRSFPVAVGTRETPTPLGHWRIQAKAVWGGAFGARWLQLSIPWGTYGIHGTNRPGSIGYRASHGCVRMFNRDVIALYNLVVPGTPVDVRGVPTRRFGEVSRTIEPSWLGSDVLAVQRRLRALGYAVGRLNGVYAGATVAAVRAFQQAHDLPATGVVNAATQSALGLRPLSEDPSLRSTPAGQEPAPPPARLPEPSAPPASGPSATRS